MPGPEHGERGLTRRAFANGEPGPKIRATFTARREAAPRIGFIMSGQGSLWWGMGRELMKHRPITAKAAGVATP